MLKKTILMGLATFITTSGCQPPQDTGVSQKGTMSVTQSELEKSSVVPTQEPPKPPKTEFTNGIGMRLKRINAGQFVMGAVPEDLNASEYELPRRSITIKKPFYIGVTEVTQQQYMRIKGENPSEFTGQSFPVHNVSWSDAVSFCEMLTNEPSEIAANRSYRLPTEAEWEYACRAGSETIFCFGNDFNELERYAHYNPLPGRLNIRGVKQVATKEPNAWGLFDMHGNVFEWCSDYYGQYNPEDIVDPQGPQSGKSRVFRGGQASAEPGYCKSSFRIPGQEHHKSSYLGFRIVMDVTNPN
jgi:formylglycine-generating enzyme required for sulfatase activity